MRRIIAAVATWRGRGFVIFCHNAIRKGGTGRTEGLCVWSHACGGRHDFRGLGFGIVPGPGDEVLERARERESDGWMVGPEVDAGSLQTKPESGKEANKLPSWWRVQRFH